LVAAHLVRDASDDAQHHRDHRAVLADRYLANFDIVQILTAGGPIDKTHVFATWAFRLGIQGNDIPLGASVSLFMVPILAVAAIFILRDINRRGNEAA
jgi:multiple sugar transport system permease protein